MPLARNPVKVTGAAVAVQVKFGKGIFDVNTTAVVVLPEHIVCCITAFVTLGEGFTFITYIAVGPLQLAGAGP